VCRYLLGSLDEIQQQQRALRSSYHRPTHDVAAIRKPYTLQRRAYLLFLGYRLHISGMVGWMDGWMDGGQQRASSNKHESTTDTATSLIRLLPRCPSHSLPPSHIIIVIIVVLL